MKFLFLVSAMLALHGCVVCEQPLPMDLFGLGFSMEPNPEYVELTFPDTTKYQVGLKTDGDKQVISIQKVNPDKSIEDVSPKKSKKSMKSKSKSEEASELIATYKMHDDSTLTVDSSTSNIVKLTTGTGSSVTVDSSDDPTFKYTNDKNDFFIEQLKNADTYTYTAGDKTLKFDDDKKTITLSKGSEEDEVYDYNGDLKTEDEDEDCPEPQTTCIIDPCTSSSNFGWNQWCIPSGFRSRSRCYGFRRSFPTTRRYSSYYC